MSGHDHNCDCGYDFNNSWEYDCDKTRKPRRRHGKKRHEDVWNYGSW